MVELFLGIVVGVVGMWLYRSEQVREQARQKLSAAPPPLQQAGQTVVTTASASAHRTEPEAMSR